MYAAATVYKSTDFAGMLSGPLAGGDLITESVSHKNSFLKLFKRLTYHRHAWQVWSDFVFLAASSIANTVDLKARERREKEYMQRIKGYDKQELSLFAELLAVVVQALEGDPEQDFLGDLFQTLELSSHWKGQFFTPYNACRLMVDVQNDDMNRLIEEKGCISVNDPTCGAGALLVAFANMAKSRGVNYQRDVLFIAQDIDRTAALMCYIQISLLGCPGYVIVGDTLLKPGLHPDNDVWYTPFYFSEVWRSRRLVEAMKGLFPGRKTDPVAGYPDNAKPVSAAARSIERSRQVLPLQLELF